ncbi:transposase [Streptomyces xiangluensis]|uniref:Transposase n=1 Tax=Streptomyces xiangluensis TaxID=2665720 RepID=A0ABV8YHN8_9ACTN
MLNQDGQQGPVCPGNYESAGKSPSGRIRPGDPWLKGVLGQAAISACRTKDIGPG